ncbi:MAG: thioesterase family protein [Maricaulaceae bacterium]|nr:thioesterase family protein [Maricaulaceae bacterium]
MIDLWRGNANAWECDELGHMNVRFYLAKAHQAVQALAEAAGLYGAFRAGTSATLIPREVHIRFLAESRPGAPLYIRGGFAGADAASALAVLVMTHAVSGKTAATFRIRLDHAEPVSGRPFAWPARFADHLKALTVDSPAEAAPRGLTEDDPETEISLARAEALGLTEIGRGRFSVQDCDVFGRMNPELLLGKVSDSVIHFQSAFPEEFGGHSGAGPEVAGALVECRQIVRRWPRAGDGFVIRSGLNGADEKVRKLVHWVLDPETGAPWWSTQGVALMMDLNARRLAPTAPETLALLRKAVVPGLRA